MYLDINERWKGYGLNPIGGGIQKQRHLLVVKTHGSMAIEIVKGVNVWPSNIEE